MPFTRLVCNVIVLCFTAGPLQAVISAQGQAAMSSIRFIQAVGFDEDFRAKNVQFAYNTTNTTTGRRQTNTMTVPLLAIIPIPFIRVSLMLAGCILHELFTLHLECYL